MIFGAIMSVISIAVMVIGSLVMLFSKAFLERITMVNSFVLAAAGGILLYLSNRSFDAFFPFQVHPAICFVVTLGAMLLFYFIQTTDVGFWIFAVLFSIVWAFATAFIMSIFITQIDKVWFWVIFGLSFLTNIGAHLRSRAETEFILG